MASIARQLVVESLRVIRSINGGHEYTYNLSNQPDRVKFASPVLTDYSDAQVWITNVDISSEDLGATGTYRRTWAMSVVGAVGADTDDAGERALCAMDLLNDVTKALESQRASSTGPFGGLVYDVKLTSTTVLDGQEEYSVPMGMFGALFTFTGKVSTGV